MYGAYVDVETVISRVKSFKYENNYLSAAKSDPLERNEGGCEETRLKQ